MKIKGSKVKDITKFLRKGHQATSGERHRISDDGLNERWSSGSSLRYTNMIRLQRNLVKKE